MSIEQVREFVFKKDLWGLDLAVSLCFALGLGAFTQYGADSGQIYPDRILFAMFCDTASFLGTFVFAFALRSKLKFLRSWAWIGIGGALVRTIVYFAAAPNYWPWFKRFSPTTYDAIKNMLSDAISAVPTIWIIWAILGCICIFIARLIAYFFLTMRKSSTLPG